MNNMTNNDDLVKRIEDAVDKKMAARLDPIDGRLEALEKGQKGLEKSQRKQGKDITYIRKTLEVAVGRFDEEDVRIGRRVTRLEKHAGLSAIE